MWNVSTNNDVKLIAIKSNEEFRYGDLLQVLSKVYLDKGGMFSSFNRYVDLSEIKKLRISLTVLLDTVKIYRKIHPSRNKVKMAVHLPPNKTSSYVHFYKMMAESDQYKYKICSSVGECAEYLNVDEGLLIDK